VAGFHCPDYRRRLGSLSSFWQCSWPWQSLPSKNRGDNRVLKPSLTMRVCRPSSRESCAGPSREELKANAAAWAKKMEEAAEKVKAQKAAKLAAKPKAH